MMDDDFVFPSKVINVVEGSAVEFARWNCKQTSRMFFNLKTDASFGQFYYEIIDKQLTIWDLLTGIAKVLLPAKPYSIRFENFVLMKFNSGLMLYELKNEVRISMVSLNFINNTYELTGCSHYICNTAYGWGCTLFSLSENFFAIKNRHYAPEHENPMICLFKSNQKTSKFEFQKFFTIPFNNDTGWFHMFEGKFLFASRKVVQIIENKILIIDGMIIQNENGSFSKLKNSKLCIQVPEDPVKYMHGSLKNYGHWHEDRLFFSSNKFYSSRYPSTFQFYFFDLKQSRWSEIRLNHSLTSLGYLFWNMEENGILNIYQCVCTYSERLVVTDVILQRLPFRKPDKLFNLSWSKAQRYNLNGQQLLCET